MTPDSVDLTETDVTKSAEYTGPSIPAQLSPVATVPEAATSTTPAPNGGLASPLKPDPAWLTASQSPDNASLGEDGASRAMEFLLVDDNPINLKMLSLYTKKLGRPYNAVANGKEALEAFCEDPGRYDCIFMDISMPVMDGFEATRRIRSYEREKHLTPVHIFALSGQNSTKAQKEAFASGIDLFLTKPVRLKELSSILESKGLLSGKQMNSALGGSPTKKDEMG